MPTDALTVADRLFGAITDGRVDDVAAVYDEHVVVWHNTDGIEQGRDENLRVLAWLVGHTTRRSYTDVRRLATADGFVQQHVLALELPDGRTAAIAACIVATVSDDRITRIDEYLDGRAVTAAFAPAS